jgi:hypothetical protein
MQIALLATPTAWLGRRPSQSVVGSPNANSGSGSELVRDLEFLLPTPTAVRSRNETSGRTTPDSKHHAGTTPDVAWKLSKNRLAVPFVEWMMGYPEGWTDGLTRTKALKALGNAVVPQQAALAMQTLKIDP